MVFVIGVAVEKVVVIIIAVGSGPVTQLPSYSTSSTLFHHHIYRQHYFYHHNNIQVNVTTTWLILVSKIVCEVFALK